MRTADCGSIAKSNPQSNPQSALRNVVLALLFPPLVATAILAAATIGSYPLASDGRPDLQGIWANDTVTPLERPKRFADKPVLSEQEAIAYEHDLIGRWSDRFGDLEVTTTGELSAEWQENGTVVPGRRTSIIVDPEDGMVPLTADARVRAKRGAEALEAHPADDPEARTLYERCLIGSSGPPMLPPVYNQNLQIVQTRDHVLIVTEMIHDARVIRINATHLPDTIRLWMGDSVGRWEGNVLVVDTTNFTTKTRFRQSGAGLHVVERFTRESAAVIRYDFTVEDAAAYSRPWSGRLSLRRTTAPMYEYACHEGNYSMIGILRGARASEAESAKRP